MNKRGRRGANKRGGLQFGWIFAVIVGAVILFLAFYFIGQLMTEERIEKGTIASRSLDIVITPLSFFGELGATTAYLIDLPQASRIDIECESQPELGSNSILLIEEGRTKFETGLPKRLYDKYLFAEDVNITEKKKFQSLTKSLYLPWRVADLTMLWPADRRYCFVHTDWNSRGIKRIKEQLGNETATSLDIESISFAEPSKTKCNYGDITVCFYRTSGCNVYVEGASKEGAGTVTKDGKTLNYAGDALMYAAIFSDPGLYKCNLNRIAKRLNLEIQVYQEKSKALEAKPPEAKSDCRGFDLSSLQQESRALEINNNLERLWSASITTKRSNDYATCKLF